MLSDGNRCQCELRVEGRRRKKEEEVFESRSKYQTRLLALHKNPNLLFLSRGATHCFPFDETRYGQVQESLVKLNFYLHYLLHITV